MNRRSILAAGLALLSTSALAQRGPRRAEIPHSELAWLWDTARASPNLDALRDTVGGRFGPLPWVFVDTIRTGSEPDGTPLIRYEPLSSVVVSREVPSTAMRAFTSARPVAALNTRPSIAPVPD